VQHLAKARLREMKPDDAVDLIKPLIAPEGSPILRARAVWILPQVLPVGDWKDVPAYLSRTDRDERMRTLAARMVDDFLPAGNQRGLGHGAKEIYFKEPSAAALREFLLFLRKFDAEEVRPFFYELAKKFDGKDVFYLRAIGIAVGKDPKRREIILADFEKHFPTWDERIPGLVFELRPPSVMAKLGDYLNDPKLTTAQKAQILDILATTDDPSAGLTLLRLIAGGAAPELRAQALKNLQT